MLTCATRQLGGHVAGHVDVVVQTYWLASRLGQLQHVEHPRRDVAVDHRAWPEVQLQLCVRHTFVRSTA